MTAHAWMLLASGNRLDLMNPHPCAWTDDDLAKRLSRTYRWCSDTRWDRPLSVAQHSLTVLHLRQAASSLPLSPAECLRELLHDAEEGLINYDAATPVKALLGESYRQMIAKLQRCINERYDLPKWDRSSYEAHKHADRLAAASEARHVVGWTEEDIRLTLGIKLPPEKIDPLPAHAGLAPWEPWPAELAAKLFRDQLVQLQRDMLGADVASNVVAIMPDLSANGESRSLGTRGQPTLVLVEGGGQTIEGQIVKGVHDEEGTWDLENVFTVQTDEGDLVKVHGWNCITEVL